MGEGVRKYDSNVGLRRKRSLPHLGQTPKHTRKNGSLLLHDPLHPATFGRLHLQEVNALGQ
ncbi:MAG: hypothetical protein D6722_04695, partial [Bacteroidetes bacterium]